MKNLYTDDWKLGFLQTRMYRIYKLVLKPSGVGSA
jgi:hypothetical protein